MLGTVALATLAFATAGAGCSSSTTRTGFDPTLGTDVDGGAGVDGGPPGSGDPTPEPQPSRPGCAQSAYTEPLPTTASLSGLPYSSTQAQAYVIAALEKRYPIGKHILEGGISSPLAASQGNCVDRFLQDKSNAQSVLRQASTLVHECGHFYDIGESTGSASAYVITDDVKFSCSKGDTTSRGGETFARSLLRGDGYYAEREACGGASPTGCDMYADIYLDGSATDGTFQSGDQGYSFVLEEAAQYVNSLATSLAFKEAFAGRKSTERDGILTFLWYIERYLRLARTEHPAAYTLLSTDSCWRQATLTVWDRGWFFLEASKGESALGIDDAALEALVKDPTLTAEIDALRRLECK